MIQDDVLNLDKKKFFYYLENTSLNNNNTSNKLNMIKIKFKESENLFPNHNHLIPEFFFH